MSRPGVMDVDRAALMRLFLSDSEDELSRLETGVLGLEAHPDDTSQVDALFRIAHTLKGNASILALDRFAKFAHTLEDLLDAVRARRTAVTAELISLLLRAVDVLRGMLKSLHAGEPENYPKVTIVEDELVAWTASGGADAVAASKAAEAEAEAEAVRAPSEGPVSPADGRWGPALRIEMSKIDHLLDLASRALVVQGQMGAGLLVDAAANADLLELHHKSERLLMELQDWVIDHGIELPAVRAAKGKNPEGTVTLRAFQNGNQVVIQVEDDGAGLNLAKIRARARQIGRADVDSLSVQELHQLVFEPGFSTADKVTELSGRGVGMDVVRRRVEDLHGTVEIDSSEGTGTTIEMRLPLSLSVIEGFWVEVAGTDYVLPLDEVLECIELPPEQRSEAESEGIVDLRGEPLAYVHLRDLLGVGPLVRPLQQIVVVRHRSRRVGLGVDGIHGERQTVIKPLGRLFRAVPGISGSTLRPDGAVAFVIDVARLMRSVVRQPGVVAFAAETTAVRGAAEI